MIYAFLLAVLTNQALQFEAARELPCNVSALSKQQGVRRVVAVIEFDGLEHTFISGTACPVSRSIEVIGGFSLPGKIGEKLYKDIIDSAKKSRAGRRFVVKFVGLVLTKQNANGEIVADIKSVTASSIELATSSAR